MVELSLDLHLAEAGDGPCLWLWKKWPDSECLTHAGLLVVVAWRVNESLLKALVWCVGMNSKAQSKLIFSSCAINKNIY